MAEFVLTTDALDDQGFFDPRYTCDLDNSSPELRWDSPPNHTASLALITEDLDTPGGPTTHWLVYNIPPTLFHLPAGIPPQESLPNGIRQGINSFGKLGYTGPCPPLRAKPHRYVIRLYALSSTLELPSRATREQLVEKISPKILKVIEIAGRYQRLVQKAG